MRSKDYFWISYVRRRGGREKLERIPVFAEFAKVRGEIDEQEYDRLVAGLLTLPGKIGKVLEDKERIPKNTLFVNTIVKVDLAEKFVDHYGVRSVNVLTDFKFIEDVTGRIEVSAIISVVSRNPTGT